SGKSGLVPVISVKPFNRNVPLALVRIAPVAGSRVGAETFPPGLLNFGVLVKLNDSARDCSVNFSVIRNWRKRPKSQLLMPGPRKRFQPAVPKPKLLVPKRRTGSAKASGSK